MTKEELKQEAEEYVCERNPLVTKKWFIDAFKKYDKGEKVKYLKDCEIAEYEAYLAGAEPREKRIAELEQENAELRKVAEFQQSSNMNRHFENKKLKEGLAIGSTFNKTLNSMNKNLEEERDKYRNMVFDKDEQLTKAKDHIKKLLDCLKQDTNDPQTNYYVCQYMDKAEQFLKDSEGK